MSESRFKDLFVWKNGKIEDVRFWCEPQLTKEALDLIMSTFSIDDIDGFVGLEARGFYLAGAASIHYNLPTIMVRKHKTFFDKMDHESVHFKNWKGESETLSIMMDSLPKKKSVIVVDDIIDTGASLKATQELLDRIGIKVIGAFYLLNSYGNSASKDFGIPVKSVFTQKLFS